jgi:short subunit dehydrogenase-like uncharacterized protein
MARLDSNASYDLIVFGATSFVGKIVCRYLMERYGDQEALRWAMAGRSHEKLQALQESLGPEAKGIGQMVVDALDQEALRTMCRQTRVVATTVGPYAFYGEPLVHACAETGTDYCDLTGEVPWMRRMIERYSGLARQSGARIVHCCGFDSIPSDLGVWFLQREAAAQFGAVCSQVKLRLKAASGGVSGGTVASLLNVLKESSRNRSLRSGLADPYWLCVEQPPLAVTQPSDWPLQFDADFDGWISPFVMAGINTRVVHRTNALLGYPYGLDFLYGEAVLNGKGYRGRCLANAAALGLNAFLLASAIRPIRYLMERMVLPTPGQGPSREKQEQGFFDLRLFGRTPQGQQLEVKVKGDRDPGYGSTAKMLAESAVCLAKDLCKDELKGGFWTPASAMSDRLLKRLEERSGVTFERI